MHQDLSYTEETKVIACQTTVVDAALFIDGMLRVNDFQETVFSKK